MAVDKKLYNTTDGTQINASKVAGVEAIHIVAQVLLTNGDGAGSIYRIAKIPAGYVPLRIDINCEAITSANDNDLGFYDSDEHGGAVISKDCLLNGGDLSSALVIGSELSGLRDLGTLNLGKKIWDLLSKSAGERQAYTFALTANAAPTATKSAVIRATFINAA